MAIKFPSNPVVGQVYTPSVLKIYNTVVSTDKDYVSFTTGSSSITAIYLTKYVSIDPKAFFAIQVGSAWTVGNDTTQMVTLGHLGPATAGLGVGDNILAGNVLAPTPVILAANTTYTMWIQQTGINSTEYVLSTSPTYQGETSLFSDYSSNAAAPTNLGTLSSNNNTWIWNGTTWAIQASSAPSFVNVSASGTITAGSFSGPLLGNSTGTHTGAVIGNVTGNASTATTLATSRLINGVSFNGSSDVTIPANAETLTGTTLKSTVTTSNLTAVGALTNLTVTGAVNTSSTITATGDITSSANVVVSTAPTATTHATNKAYVDAKSVAMAVALG
jgi:hypothetical protein